MRQSLSAISFSFFSQAVLRSFTIAHIHTYFSSFLFYRNCWRSNTIHWSQQVIRSRGSVTDILPGVISSPWILLREIYPNHDFPHDRLRDITHDSVRTGSTSVISPTTHRGLELTCGERFLSPSDLYKYRDQWIKKHWVHSTLSVLVLCIPLVTYTTAPVNLWGGRSWDLCFL